MPSDIFPTGWYGVVLAGVTPGDRVAVFGAGPVGLMAAHSAMLMGASQVFVVDQLGDRLKLATSIGATAIDFSGRRPGRLPGSRPRRRRAPRTGRATPSFIVSHELDLVQAVEGYDHFDKRDEGWTKVLLHPGAK